MYIDIFSELQRAQSWSSAAEASVIANALEQAKVADRSNYGCWWSVEHHGAAEFSQSSTPEMFNVALAMVTERIRIGHSGVLTPYAINHPIRVAERGAFVDLISGGRLEMGLARSSSSEWDTFGVPKELTQPQFDELCAMLPRMWSDGVFQWESELIKVPPLNIIPKPRQKFPRLWCMGTSVEGAKAAGRLKLGFVGTTVLEPVKKTENLLKSYRQARLESPLHVDYPNDGFGLFTFVHCAASIDEAIKNRAAESALWYVNRAPVFFKRPRESLLSAIRAEGHAAGASWRQSEPTAGAPAPADPNDPHPVIRLLNRQFLGMELDPVEAFEALDAVDSVIIGDPARCAEKMAKFAGLGVDRLLCLQQFGFLGHEVVKESIRLIGDLVAPRLAVGHTAAAAVAG